MINIYYIIWDRYLESFYDSDQGYTKNILNAHRFETLADAAAILEFSTEVIQLVNADIRVVCDVPYAVDTSTGTL